MIALFKANAHLPFRAKNRLLARNALLGAAKGFITASKEATTKHVS